MRRIFFGLLLLLLTLGLVPFAQATSYIQPMLGRDWGKHTLIVSIPASPDWANSAISESLDAWNQSQEWFVHSWFPDHPDAIFTLKATTWSPDITIRYVIDTGQSWNGQTSSDGRTVLIVLSRFSESYSYLVTHLASHELGHALGLWHTSISNDLMIAASRPGLAYPSTLNLYAIYLEANGATFQYGNTVTLPSTIPYIMWSPGILPVPEYSTPTLLAVIPLLLSVLMVKRYRFNAS